MELASQLCHFVACYAATLWPFLDNLLLVAVDILRLGSGGWVASGVEKCHRPKKPLELYEYQFCPFCKVVRETLSVLDIDHVVYPCPRETLTSYGVSVNSRYRPSVMKLGGELKFPFLVDPNKDVKMHESDHIISYLWDTYGNEASPPRHYKLSLAPLVRSLTTTLSMLCRPCSHMGLLRCASRTPEKNLELWGFDGSPFVRRVQEKLSCCELPYLFHVVAHGSKQKRTEFMKTHNMYLSPMRKQLGFIQVPFLRDPNTGMEIFDSRAIVDYIEMKYQTAPVPEQSWSLFGTEEKKGSEENNKS